MPRHRHGRLRRQAGPAPRASGDAGTVGRALRARARYLNAGITSWVKSRRLRLTTEEVREALARLLDRARFRRGDVDRNSQVDAGIARMPGAAPGLPVLRQVGL